MIVAAGDLRRTITALQRRRQGLRGSTILVSNAGLQDYSDLSKLHVFDAIGEFASIRVPGQILSRIFYVLPRGVNVTLTTAGVTTLVVETERCRYRLVSVNEMSQFQLESLKIDLNEKPRKALPKLPTAKAGTVVIRNSSEKPVVLSASILGRFAIHQEFPESKPIHWRVTHVPTGLGASPPFSTRRQALVFAAALDQSPDPGVSSSDKDTAAKALHPLLSSAMAAAKAAV